MGTYQVTVKVETEQTYLVDADNAVDAEDEAVERFSDEDPDTEDRTSSVRVVTIWISNDDESEADEGEAEEEEEELDEAA